MMTEAFVSPKSISKMKTKECINKIKHGSPKFNDILRQRCREKMREKRRELFNERRSCDDSSDKVHNALGKIFQNEYFQVMKELQEMNVDSDTMKYFWSVEEASQLEKEIAAENEQWIIQEYEKFLEPVEEMLSSFNGEDSKSRVICPLCQRALLENNLNSIVCRNCNFDLPNRVSLETLKKILENTAGQHSLSCSEVPGFAIFPDDNVKSLYMVCSKCSDMIHLL